MANNIKHYLKVGAVLGAIGLVSAALIVAVNIPTSPLIEKNKQKKIDDSLRLIFNDDNVVFSGKNDVVGTYLTAFYTAEVDSNIIGRVYAAKGSNSYGSISLMVGISNDANGSIGRIELIENTESFASTIKNSYLVPLNEGKIELDDVKCGATYGAKLIRDMAQEAQTHFLETMKK